MLSFKYRILSGGCRRLRAVPFTAVELALPVADRLLHSTVVESIAAAIRLRISASPLHH